MKKLIYVCTSFFLLSGCMILGAAFFCLNNQWIDFSQLESFNQGKPSIVLDDQANEWTRFSLDRRDPVTLEQIPEHLILAFVAAEDHNFFSHSGISYKGIVRSLLVNVYNRRIVQGASTITQQLVKLLYTDLKRTYQRKIKDQILALIVEQQYTKEQIMQTYLNHVCFGCGIFGVQAASQRFWGKSPIELTIDEAATLAAIVKNPTNYCPLLYPESSERRRNIVLHSMHSLGFITSDEFQRAKEAPVMVKSQEYNQRAPHFKEWVRLFLEERVGKHQLYTGGLTIKTTINIGIQDEAERQFKEHVAHLKETITPRIDGGLLSIDIKTGAIKAMVGGYDFNQSKFNRALQAHRQIASTFKLIIFAAAIASGRQFDETEIDEPIEIQQGGTTWKPRNSSRNFVGTLTLGRALAVSNNIVPIKTLLSVGCQIIVDYAKKFRIQQELHPYPSLALGCIDATLKEVIGMFNVFANNGTYIEPHSIVWVKDAWGSKIYRAHPDEEKILHSRVSGQVAKVLTNGLERIRKRSKPGDWIPCQAFAKTGTTNDARTNWFIGATPELTTAIYIGRDDNQSMGRIFPVTTAFPIWKKMMQAIPVTKKQFSFDSSLREVIIDSFTGKPLDSINKPRAIVIFK